MEGKCFCHHIPAESKANMDWKVEIGKNYLYACFSVKKKKKKSDCKTLVSFPKRDSNTT